MALDPVGCGAEESRRAEADFAEVWFVDDGIPF